MIRGILFDKDGTLFDFNLSWGRWAVKFVNALSDEEARRRKLAEALMLDYDRAAFDPASPVVAGTSDEIFKAVAEVFPEMSRGDIAQIVTSSTQAADLVSVCDLGEYLGDLRARGLRLGVATNDEAIGAQMQLSRENAVHYFDYIAGYDSGYGAKPDPGMCVGFLEAVGLQPQEAAMVGDSIFDIIAGREAGMITIGVLTGTASREDLAMADVVLNDITKIPDWLQKEN